MILILQGPCLNLPISDPAPLIIFLFQKNMFLKYTVHIKINMRIGDLSLLVKKVDKNEIKGKKNNF